MRRSVLVIVSAFCCVLWATAAPAQQKWKDTHVGKCKLEAVWDGPTLDESSLFGKVIVVIFWEADNDGSLKALANLVKLEKRYKRYGLVAIAAYKAKPMEENAKAKAISSARSRRVSFTVVSAGRIFAPGKVIEKVPHAVVYNHTGNTAYNDYPGQAMDKKILESLKRRPTHPALVFVRDYNEDNYKKDKFKFMLLAIAKIKQDRLADAWKDCDARKDDVNQRGDQARKVLDGLDKYADRLMQRAEEAKSNSPLKATELLTKVCKAYRKSPKGEAAAKMLKEWTSDTKFQAERQAEIPFRVIERMAKRIPPRPMGGPERKIWERRWKSRFGTLKRALEKFEKGYADTEFAEKAKGLVTGIAEGTSGKSILD